MLGWAHHKLAKGSSLHHSDVSGFEKGRATPLKNVTAIQKAFETAGLRFIGQTGVDRPEPVPFTPIDWDEAKLHKV